MLSRLIVIALICVSLGLKGVGQVGQVGNSISGVTNYSLFQFINIQS